MKLERRSCFALISLLIITKLVDGLDLLRLRGSHSHQIDNKDTQTRLVMRRELKSKTKVKSTKHARKKKNQSKNSKRHVEDEKFWSILDMSTEMPSDWLSLSMNIETQNPTSGFTIAPSTTSSPSAFASSTPSSILSNQPSGTPSKSILPSSSPSIFPSKNPSTSPSQQPSNIPSQVPSLSPSQSMIPSSIPTFCGGFTPDSRIAEIEDILEGISDPVNLNDPSTPQGKALKFITEDDQLLPPYCPSDPRLIQRYVLTLFYYATNGDSWFDDKGFLSSTEECNWGVSCDARDRVVVIRIDHDNLSGTIPSEISFLPRLFDLDLDGNELIGGTIPESIGELELMTTIDLDTNQITGTIPESIYNLPNLHTLDLNNNDISGTISENISKLSDLLLIQLDENGFHGTIPSILGTLENMQVITIANNTITGSIPTELGNLQLLRFLNIEGNQITGSIPTEVGQMIDLEVLELNGNQLTGTIPTEIGLLSVHLERLELQDNLLTGDVPSAICGLFENGKLEVLSADCISRVSCSCCTLCF